MKPFNLEEYKKNPNRKVIRKDRSPVRIICTDCKGPFPVIVLYWDEYLKRECAIPYTAEGHVVSTEENSCDLFFAPEKHEGWINIYNRQYERGYEVGMHMFPTKESAIERSLATPVATVKIEWED